MKTTLLIAVVLITAFLLSEQWKGSGASAQAEPTTPATKALLVQRVSALREIEDATRQRQSTGAGPIELHEAVIARLGAELELAESKAERLALLEARVKEAQGIEAIILKKVSVGVAAQIDVLQARVRRLDLEIAHARENG